MTFYKLSLFFLSLAFAQAAYPASLIWKVSQNDRHMFIAADRPYPFTSDFEVPAEYIRALKAADAFYVQAKWGLPKSATEEEKSEKSLFYPDGKDIWSALDRKTAYRLKKFVNSHYALQVMEIDTFRPGLILNIIPQVGYYEVKYELSIEDKLMMKAFENGKLPGRLGSTAERLDHLLGMDQGPYLGLINYRLDYFTSLPGQIDELDTAISSGDAAALDRLLLDPYRKAYPAAYEYEIVRTVQSLLPHLEAKLANEQVEFALLNAQYLLGKDGVLEQLRKNGATVTQL